ncbi:D-hexose-6-phosphate mutarotase [Entomospira culicis]|uniref:Putative glucose-6-phosphate 1-epimerase n=1 Tax=Entomospira culicis TaxID=2719989 RepID=A0A968GJ23_9SPIO|nr:D-hexose-6-phosphate mutarotase [Entomospira culicis]NIZ19748.1 D-hexose-6-phosphate mutarotase [Entomospira culicis]NIZ69962.1 D-hexose-6-phosphate mutarotase [Entomospira culicis]WDI37067.1 D-hexose-6-phosphate mutarotase [Entomospira culicis]WDI38696.1 D-hexose-6-phosphate mutarotase [Entomospira culicis]
MISELCVGGQDFIQLENERFEVLISRYGAQIMAILPKGGDVDAPDWLWLSEKSPLTEGKAMRGGIPICWPIFGEDMQGRLPKHGFARLQQWSFIGDHEDEKNQEVAVSFRLRDNDLSRRYWPYAFELEFAVRLTMQGVECQFEVKNTDVNPFEHAFALHPYFHVSGLSAVELLGIEGASYQRAGENSLRTWQLGDSLDMARDDAFIDMADATITLKDHGWQRSMQMRYEGVSDLVVWNPHAEGTKQISDMHADGYKTMLCVEPAQVARVSLTPQASWMMRMQMHFT